MFNCIWFLSALGVGPVIMVFNHDVFRDLATLHSAFFFQAAVCETAIPSDSWMHQIRQIVAIPLIRLGIKPQRPWFHTV